MNDAEKLEEKNENYFLKLLLKIIYIIEIILFILNLFLTCTCGHHLFKVIPWLIFMVLEFVIYIKNFKDKNSNKIKPIHIIIAILLFILLLVLCKNDMQKLHSALVIE